ncbi:MAG: REP-associated tyrosine transposase [Gammaproteobacteria bacterium]
MQYHRDLTAGETYFFTVATFRRIRLFDQLDNVERLRAAFREERMRRSFNIDAIVILPDHIHAIWTLPQDDADYSMRWRNIKRSFTAAIGDDQRPRVFAGRRHINRNKPFGKASAPAHASCLSPCRQRRFWEHRIRDQADFNRHVDYLHYNPVKHGYVSLPSNLP